MWRTLKNERYIGRQVVFIYTSLPNNMKSFTTAVALASIVPAIVSLTVNTPSSVVQCQPQLIGWSDGVPPYYLSIIPGGQPAATPLKSFDTQTGNSLTWKVDIMGGTVISLALKDSTGAVAYSDKVTIQQGSDSSCLSGAGSPPPPAPPVQDVSVNASNVTTSGPPGTVAVTGAPRATSSAFPGTATRAASVGSAAPNSATQSVSRTTTTPARASATSSSGAESSLSGHNYGLVGAVGLIGALFL